MMWVACSGCLCMYGFEAELKQGQPGLQVILGF